MLLLDGKIARDSKVDYMRRLIRALGFTPTLAILHVGMSERSRAYVGAKKKFADAIGANVELVGFPQDATTEDVLYEIQRLNSESSINGIIVQLPLPRGVNQGEIIEAIDPSKDVDGLTSKNLKFLLENNQNGFLPATAKGVLSLLSYYSIPLEGSHVVVVGRSLLVGKTTALALLNQNATVTICHKHTRNLPEMTKNADILVIAVGHPRLIKEEHVSMGQIVVDVGINLDDGERLAEEIAAPKLVGDVDFDAVKSVVNAISPVPGGVGPMTVLSLFENLLEASQRQARAAF